MMHTTTLAMCTGFLFFVNVPCVCVCGVGGYDEASSSCCRVYQIFLKAPRALRTPATRNGNFRVLALGPSELYIFVKYPRCRWRRCCLFYYMFARMHKRTHLFRLWMGNQTEAFFLCQFVQLGRCFWTLCMILFVVVVVEAVLFGFAS